MKKVLVINTKYQKYGGEDSNFLEEINFLKKFYTVDYLIFDNSKKISIFDIIGFFTLSNFSSNKKLKLKLNSFNPDIVYIHNTWFKANLGIFNILKKANVETILKIHNFRFSCTNSFSAASHFRNKDFCYKCGNNIKGFNFFNKYFNNSYTKSLFVILYGKKYINILREHNIKLIVLNKFYKEYLVKENIKESKIFINYNPFEVSNNFIYSPDSEYAVYAGSLVEQKGVEELLQAWRKSNVSLKLLIIGSGELENKLVNEYSSRNIEFLGFLENKKTIEIIKNSRAVITATKMFEGQPRLISEASAFGVPSIYPSFGGLDEYFPDNYKLSFKQFDYSDLVKKIIFLQNKILLKEESKKIRNHVIKNMSLDKLNIKFRNILNSNE